MSCYRSLADKLKNRFFQKNRGAAKLPYPLLVCNYRNILDYDSWLDCSDILEVSKLKITEKNGTLKGCLIPEDRERIMEFLKETDIFDNATKKRYGII